MPNTKWSRKVAADLRRKHRKWPLGTVVWVRTPHGMLRGMLVKHWRKGEVADGASVEFQVLVDMGDLNGPRFSHVIPFRSMRPVGAEYVDATQIAAAPTHQPEGSAAVLKQQ